MGNVSQFCELGQAPQFLCLGLPICKGLQALGTALRAGHMPWAIPSTLS